MGEPQTRTKYIYDAEGQRVERATAGLTLDYVYDLSVDAVAAFNKSNGGWWIGEVFAGRRHLATYTNGTTYFNHVDWLGTERVRTAISGAVCESTTSLPFGDGQTTSGSCADSSTHHFTGKERDSESGLDNFGARYNSSSVGRFMSPDSLIPFNLKRRKFQEWISSPQHWNKYAYALNNPSLYVDPSGMTETVYYWLNSSLTDEQRAYFLKHKTEILNDIADKLKQAGIKDVVFKDGSTLTKSQVSSILEAQPKGVAFLNFADKSYAGVTPPPEVLGNTDGMRSAVFVGNLQGGNPSDSVLSFRISEVSDHELGHTMGFYSHDSGFAFLNWIHNMFSNDLMNEGQNIPSRPEAFDMSIPQNRQAVDEINKLPVYIPQP